MILRTNLIHEDDLRNAAEWVGVGFLLLRNIAGERAQSVYVWEVRLKGSSTFAPRGYPGYKTATWEEWGKFLAFLYRLDPRMKTDSPYKDAEDFHNKTEGRFSGYAAEIH